MGKRGEGFGYCKGEVGKKAKTLTRNGVGLLAP